MKLPVVKSPAKSITEHQIRSLAEFLGYVKDNCRVYDTVLFRGQREDLPLLPKIARIRHPSRWHITECEERMFSDLKLRTAPYLTSKPTNPWDWLALAQHHRMATRLLDWTTNPLAALWFATERPPIEAHPAVVWIYHPPVEDVITDKEGESPFDGTKTKVFQADHITGRIVAQAGWFTVHKYQSAKTSEFIALDKLKRAKSHLTKLTVPAKEFSAIRSELDRCGVNSATLFPDLDGVCSHIEWLYSLLEDEPDELPSFLVSAGRLLPNLSGPQIR